MSAARRRLSGVNTVVNTGVRYDRAKEIVTDLAAANRYLSETCRPACNEFGLLDGVIEHVSAEAPAEVPMRVLFASRI